MKTFKNIDRFNEKLQDSIEMLDLNVEAKSYEDLKKEPDKYKFYESENYITFILKERKKDSERMVNFIVFRGYAGENDINLQMFSIYELELEFMYKEAAKEIW